MNSRRTSDVQRKPAITQAELLSIQTWSREFARHSLRYWDERDFRLPHSFHQRYYRFWKPLIVQSFKYCNFLFAFRLEPSSAIRWDADTIVSSKSLSNETFWLQFLLFCWFIFPARGSLTITRTIKLFRSETTVKCKCLLLCGRALVCEPSRGNCNNAAKGLMKRTVVVRLLISMHFAALRAGARAYRIAIITLHDNVRIMSFALRTRIAQLYQPLKPTEPCCLCIHLQFKFTHRYKAARGLKRIPKAHDENSDWWPHWPTCFPRLQRKESLRRRKNTKKIKARVWDLPCLDGEEHKSPWEQLDQIIEISCLSKTFSSNWFPSKYVRGTLTATACRMLIYIKRNNAKWRGS